MRWEHLPVPVRIQGADEKKARGHVRAVACPGVGVLA